MGLSTAERNRQKRERKKRAKEEERKRLDAEKESLPDSNPDDVEIEYVAEPLLAASGDDKDADPANGDESAAGGDEDNSISAVLRRFQARTTALVSDDEKDAIGNDDKISSEEKEANEYEDESAISKRKLRDMSRPTVAELKNRVDRADLVEAHDVTSKDPDFLLFLKSVRSTVSVPRHWGRKRKYLQGKVSTCTLRQFYFRVFSSTSRSFLNHYLCFLFRREVSKKVHFNYQISLQKLEYQK
jgi:splicing factor 3B subunit 2